MSEKEKVQKAFFTVEEAEASGRNGKSKDGSEKEWTTFCVEFTRDVKEGTKCYTRAGNGGVGLNFVAQLLGIKVYVANGGRGGSRGPSLNSILQSGKWDEVPEEVKAKLKASLKEDEKKQKAAAKAAAKNGKVKKESKEEELEEAAV